MGRKVFVTTFLILLILGSLFIFFECNPDIDRWKYSIYKENGFWSIFTGSFIHNSVYHFINNCKILIFTIPMIYYLYKKDFWNLMILGILIPNITVYAADLQVIGISGLVFCHIWFLIFSGLGSKNKERFVASLIIAYFYADSFLQFIPTFDNFVNRISWQMHLSGVIVALIYSIFRLTRKS